MLSNPSGPPRGEPEPGSKYRLVTQSNFDGLVCAVILEQLDMIDDIIFVHPNDMQQGRIKISDNDICTNLPYVPGCHLGFDHHESELLRLGQKFDNHIIIPEAPSAARVVYDYYGGNEGLPNVSPELMDAVDQGTSAQYSMDEVLNPQRWALINFIMDFRTGLGRFRGFRIPNYELMMNLIEYCQFYSIEEILEIEDVKERVIFYKEQTELFKEQVERCSTIHGNLVVLDLREEVIMYVGNRFMIYALLPQCNISMHIMWGRDKQNVVFACGKSIFNRSSKTGIDDLMLKYGGGGHHAAGTCQIDSLLFNTVCTALIQQITEDG
ncbi:MAG: exopolyphosphatase [Rhodospirillales bacterium]